MTTDTPRTDAETYVWQDGGKNPFVHRDFARQLERELAVSLKNQVKTQAEVERLKAKLYRAIEIADEFWKNQKQAVLVYHQELADELDQIKERICGD